MKKLLEIGPSKKGKISPEWETMDKVPGPNVDMNYNIEEMPLPIKDETYDFIYMSHVLEHISWEKTVDVLKELRRILKTGGSLEIWVPDFNVIFWAYDDDCIPGQDKWRHKNPDNNLMTWINGRLFTYGPDHHKACFDYSYLRECLKKSGFEYKNILGENEFDGPTGLDDHGIINLGVRAVK